MKKVTVIGSDYAITDMFNKHPDYYVNKSDSDHADVVCFIGGADVSPQFYGQQALGGTNTSSKADQRDFNAWKFFTTSKDEPLFCGICRGGQFLNVMNGGKMWQHVDGHGRSHELIDVLTDKKITVTSTHHQMMRAAENGEVLGIAYEARAFADDKISVATTDTKKRSSVFSGPQFDTEVIWYKDTRSLCFQPHPEYSSKETTDYFFELLNKLY